MRFLFDQLAKGICGATLSQGGLVHTHHEVVSDGQTVDVWSLPDPARSAERKRIGLLGRMAEGPTILEPFHNTPGIDELRNCLHKQLAMDRSRVTKARSDGDRRPPFPRLWVLSTGRPASVIKGYGFKAMRGWPKGFLERHDADQVGLVVVRELPRERATLLLRLMGAGAVLTRAIAELTALPKKAFERILAMPFLIALRREIPQNSADDEERMYLMSTMELYEEWKQKTEAKGIKKGIKKGIEKGREETLKQVLVAAYRVRFGALPADLAAVIEATHDVEVLSAWHERIVVGTRKQIAAALLSTSAPST
jgi:hypothetical protein